MPIESLIMYRKRQTMNAKLIFISITILFSLPACRGSLRFLGNSTPKAGIEITTRVIDPTKDEKISGTDNGAGVTVNEGTFENPVQVSIKTVSDPSEIQDINKATNNALQVDDPIYIEIRDLNGTLVSSSALKKELIITFIIDKSIPREQLQGLILTELTTGSKNYESTVISNDALTFNERDDGMVEVSFKTWVTYGIFLLIRVETPNAPSEFTGVFAPKDKIELSWKDNASNETGFKIERLTLGEKVSPTDWTLLDELAPNETVYLDKDLILGESYKYRIYAFNNLGSSNIHETEFIEILPDPPMAPTFLYIIPLSPSSDISPKITGIPSNDTDTIGFYSNDSCSEPSIGQGTKSDFANIGIEMTVPINSETSIYARAFDIVGASSDCVFFVSYIHDSMPPTENSMIINSNNPYTQLTTVTLTLNSTDASEMYITDTAGCESGGHWETFSTTKSWTLSQTNTTVSVYAKFRDVLENTSSCINDSIIHDTQPPSAPNVSGTTPTRDQTPTWSWTTSGGGNGSFRYKIDNSDLSSGATETTSATFTPETNLSDGDHTLYVQERDAAGNWSNSGSKLINIDRTPPNQAASFSSVSHYQSVALSWAAPAAGETPTGYLIVQGTAALTGNPVDGTNYSVGNAVGSGNVVYVGDLFSYTKTNLTSGTRYYYAIYTYDAVKNYSTSSVLTNAQAGYYEVGYFGGIARRIAYAANKVYMLKGGRSLEIYNVTTPTSPTLLGKLDLTGYATSSGIILNGNYAYIAKSTDGLHIVDISNPATPTLVVNYNTSGSASKVFINGNYAYIANGTGMIIVDISTPSAPILKSSYPLANIKDVAVAGNYAYAVVYPDTLVAINVSDPLAPTYEGTLTESGWYFEEIALDGNYAYISDFQGNGVASIDISNPTNPTLAGSRNSICFNCYGINVSGTKAYVAGSIGGPDGKLFIVDISTPTNPTISGSLSVNPGGYTYDVAVNGNYAYVANEGLGLSVVDISNPALPSLAATYLSAGYPENVVPVGNYAYVASGYLGLLVFDISTPSAPSLIGNYNTPGYVRNLAVNGNYAYLCDGSTGDLIIVNISTPSSPVLAGTYNGSGDARDVKIVGNYAYLADGDLTIIDISTPATPSLAGSYVSAGSSQGVAISGNYAYIADFSNDLVVVDISAPGTPSLVTTLETGSFAYNVLVNGNYLYVSDISYFRVVDITTPSSPTILGSVSNAVSTSKLLLNGNYVYVATKSNSSRVIDISNPASPSVVGDFTYGNSSGVAIQGGYLYVVHSDLHSVSDFKVIAAAPGM